MGQSDGWLAKQNLERKYTYFIEPEYIKEPVL